MAPRLHLAAEKDPRERVLAGYADTVTDAGLLSILIGESTLAGASALLDAHPIPDGLWRVSAEDLVALEGVGPAGAARVLACLEMSRRASAWRSGRRPTVSTPEDVVELCGAQLRGLDREHFWLLALNTKNHPGGKIWVAKYQMRVNGQVVPYLRNANHEATRASKLLTKAAGFEVSVRSCVVVLTGTICAS